MIHLTKYANNKMYNAQTGRYVNLSEIKALIQNNNEKFQVIEYTTGADITAQVLSQVLAQTRNVNAEALRQLIEKGE